MTEPRLKVESGPPQHMIDERVDAAPESRDEPGKAEQAKDKAQHAAAPAKEKAEQVKDRAQQAAGPAKEKAREVAGEAKGHAQAAAEQAKAQAAAQVDHKSTQVGQQIGSQAEALHAVAGALRNQGKDGPANVAEQAAEKVKNVGNYLEQADGESLVAAAQDAARENLAAAAAVGAAAGFAAGRVVKASGGEDAPEDEPAREGGG